MESVKVGRDGYSLRVTVEGRDARLGWRGDVALHFGTPAGLLSFSVPRKLFETFVAELNEAMEVTV